jgi:hypothetical protein
MSKPTNTGGQPKGFPSKYVYSAGDPGSIGSVPPGVGVAIQVGAGGATDAQIDAFIKSHPNNPLILWEQEASHRLVEATNKYHPVGAILGGESAGQMNSGAAIRSQLGNTPTVFEANGNYVSKWPKDTGVHFTYYKNQDMPTLTPQNLADFLATAIAEGATSIGVTLGSYGDAPGNMAQYQADLNKAMAILKSKGIDTSNVVISVYRWDMMTPESQQQFMNVNPVTGPAAAGGAAQGATSGSVSQKPKAKQKPKSAAAKKPDPPPELGIQHEKPLSAVKSHGYKGEDDPRLTYSYTDKAKNDNTLTFRPNGMVIQTKADGTSFVVWDPNAPGHNGQHWPGFKNQAIPDPYEGATFNEDAHAKVGADVKTPTGAATPAWHVNPGWKGLDEGTKAALKSINGIDQDQVLEEREGANSNIVIFRMADGTYKSLDLTTGQVAGAGTWAKDQWNSTGYGPKITGGGTNSTSSSSQASNGTAQGATSGSVSQSAKLEGRAEVSSIQDDLKSKGVDLSTHGSVVTAVKGNKNNYIVQMSDGSYQSVDIDTGAVSKPGAGIWGGGDGSGYSKITHKNSKGEVDPEYSGGSGGNNDDKPPVAPGPTNPVAGPQKDPYADEPLNAAFAPPPTGGGSCFPAGSLVLTVGGHHKPIEDVVLGDLVKTWNFDTKQMEDTEVTDILAHHQKPTIIINTDRGSIVTTPEHPFWDGRAWRPAGKLSQGAKIYHQIGELCEITSVEEGVTTNVYNFHVTNPAHNYFVNGFLVHNMKMIN